MNGLLVIDKPAGKTSRDAVNAVQKHLPRGTRIGHTGTLDPRATGVLVVCIGSATRLVEFVQDLPKSYSTIIRLGVRSTTDDADGELTESPDPPIPDESRIRELLPEFLGDHIQTPPDFSAARVEGRRAYDLARKGVDLSLSARTVRIDAIRLVTYAWPLLTLEIDCGKGTYIRSIARDLGEKLACGGIVQELRRTRLGPFTPELPVPPEHLPAPAAHLLPMHVAVAGLPQ